MSAGGAGLGRAGLGALLGALAIACLPTVGTLGYPSALLASPLFALFGVALALRQAPRAAASFGALARPALRRASIVWLAGLAILAASSLAQGNLDLAFGAACYALGPVLSSFVGWTCGLLAGLVATRRWTRALFGYAPFVLSLALSLLRLYRDPVVFAHDPFFGAFSGGIYDLDFELSGTYLAYRALNVAVCVALLVLALRTFEPGRARWVPRRLAGRPFTTALAASALAAGLAVLAQPERFGLHQTAPWLARLLGGTRASARFVVHHQPERVSARELDALVSELELWWTLLEQQLGAAPAPPVEVFLFEDAAHKRRLLGVGAAEVAAPWRRQIYLQRRGDPHPVLPHELAHLFGAPFGDPLFGVALDPPRVDAGLIEGFAEALGGVPQGPLDVHDRAAILARLELAPALDALFGWGFWAAPPARAYDAAGSFCRWILERDGADALTRLYATAGDFEGVLGRPLAELEREWRAFLETRAVSAEDVERQRLRFERGSVFERPHAYRVARLERRVGRAAREGRLARARSIQAEIAGIEPEEPRHRIVLARLLAAEGDLNAARSALLPLAEDARLPALLRGAVAELLGDVALAAGALDAAVGRYDAALALPIFEDERRRVELKRHAARAPEHAGAWLRYLAPFALEPDADALARRRLEAALALRELEGERALASYLAALQHLALYEHAPAAALLDEVLIAGALASADFPLAGFERAAREARLLAAARLGQLELAAELLATLRATPRGAGDERRYALWQRRLSR